MPLSVDAWMGEGKEQGRGMGEMGDRVHIAGRHRWVKNRHPIASSSNLPITLSGCLRYPNERATARKARGNLSLSLDPWLAKDTIKDTVLWYLHEQYSDRSFDISRKC